MSKELKQFTVIGFRETNGQICCHHVMAKDGTNAFAAVAAGVDGGEGINMVVAMPGFRFEEGFEEGVLTFPGAGIVDGGTVLEQSDVFGEPPPMKSDAYDANDMDAAVNYRQEIDRLFASGKKDDAFRMYLCDPNGGAAPGCQARTQEAFEEAMYSIRDVQGHPKFQRSAEETIVFLKTNGFSEESTGGGFSCWYREFAARDQKTWAITVTDNETDTTKLRTGHQCQIDLEFDGHVHDGEPVDLNRLPEVLARYIEKGTRSFGVRQPEANVEITGDRLQAKGQFKVSLCSAGNPDCGQYPTCPVYGVPKKMKSVGSLEEASKACREYINEHDLGGGNWTGGQVFLKDRHVANISYNGRVWEVPEGQAQQPPLKRSTGLGL